MIQFSNDFAKSWLARKGSVAVFGHDVDVRGRLSEQDAIARFDKVWKGVLEPALAKGRSVKIDAYMERFSERIQERVDRSAMHREFWVGNSLFVAQLPTPDCCTELWFVPSFKGDPRLLLVKFPSQPSRTSFQQVAKRLGLNEEELVLELIGDFMRKVEPGLKKLFERASAADTRAAKQAVTTPEDPCAVEKRVGKFTVAHPTDQGVRAEYGWDCRVGFFVTVYNKYDKVLTEYDSMRPGYADLRGALEVLAKRRFFAMEEIEATWIAMSTAYVEELPAQQRLAGKVIMDMKKAAD